MKESGLEINGRENIKCSVSTNFMDIYKIILFAKITCSFMRERSGNYEKD